MRVFVTGGASGIGLAIARRFLDDGHHVYICDQSASAVQNCLDDRPELQGGVGDVSDPADVERLIRNAESIMDGIDVLVNNAGIAGPRAATEEISYQEFDQTMRVNLYGMFNTARNVIPGMKARRCGAIVNIGTSSARTGLPMRTPYVVSKSAVLGLTLNLARELGPFGIRCNCVMPGAVANERGRNIVAAMADRRGTSYDEVEQDVLSHISMRCWIDSDEVAGMVAFLASDDARHVSGQVIGVCGHVEWEG